MGARRDMAISAALLAVTIGGASAAELVVVEARNIDLKEGQTLDDAKPLVLKEGQQVTLIGANGNILKLRGPYDQAPAAGTGRGTAEIRKALEALTTKNAVRLAGGTVRATTDVVELPDPWVVDVSHPGNVCLREGERVVFWRQGTGSSETLTVMPADHSWRARTQWPGGTALMEAPTDFPLKDHETYLADLGGRPVAVTLNAIPKAVVGDRMQAAWMFEKGCIAQAEALLKPAQ